MDIKKLNPWNWFKHEEKQQRDIPVKQADILPASHPFSGMLQLHREIDRLFDNAFRGVPAPGQAPLLNRMLDNDFIPAFHAHVDVLSDDKNYTITLEVPGLEQKDISLELQDRTLLIKGNKQQEKEEKDKHFYRIERHYGTFERILAIPEDGDAEQISASMKNGILTVTIPREDTVDSSVRKIEID